MFAKRVEHLEPTGASPLIFYVIMALVEQEDEVIYADPGFFTYEPVTIFAGGGPRPVHLIEEKGFSIDIDEIKDKVTPRMKLLILKLCMIATSTL